MQVNIHEAKTHLSRLIEVVESGAETEVVIARAGKPTVKLVLIEPKKKPPLLGIAQGQFVVPDNFDELDAEIEKLFYGECD